MKRLSSLRATRAPIPSTPIPSSLFRRHARAGAHLAGRGEDRLHDVVVAGAAAEIAFQLVTNGLLVEPAAVAADHVDGRHDHARRAEAALQAMMLAESGLDGMQMVAFRQPFDRH